MPKGVDNLARHFSLTCGDHLQCKDFKKTDKVYVSTTTVLWQRLTYTFFCTANQTIKFGKQICYYSFEGVTSVQLSSEATSKKEEKEAVGK